MKEVKIQIMIVFEKMDERRGKGEERWREKW